MNRGNTHSSKIDLSVQIRATAFGFLNGLLRGQTSEFAAKIAAPTFSETNMHRAKEAPINNADGSETIGFFNPSVTRRSLVGTIHRLLDFITNLLAWWLEAALTRPPPAAGWAAPRAASRLPYGSFLGLDAARGCGRKTAARGGRASLECCPASRSPTWCVLSSSCCLAELPATEQLLMSRGTRPRAPAKELGLPLDAEGPSHGRPQDAKRNAES